MQHHTVDVSGGRAIELIKAMIEEYMALFATDKFNICADETFDLGKGKSKPLADEKGVHRLYIDYVKELCEFLVAKGKKPMFWGDIICAQPELIKELPEETVCLTWGYAAEQREHEAKVMAEAGARQYLCPGVGGWNQWMNLVENSYKNIARMCGYARKYHAEGVLNTDWGDCGHINQPDFSLPGMIYGAVFSWGEDTDRFEELNEQISRLAYGDRSGKFVSYMAKTAECSIFDWWDANVVYEEKVLGHPNNRNALFDARIQDEAKRAAAHETIAALKKELKKTAGKLEESCRPMVPVLELTMDAIDLWNETGARLCDIELGKEKDEAACKDVKISISYENGEQQVYLNGVNVTGRLRTEEAGKMASATSAYLEVRKKLVELQQEMAENTDLVMDGRDIGTAVLPNAPLKVYLTASAHVRALRRWKELTEKGQTADLAKIEEDINERDYQDMHREHSPLVQAEDAVLVDSSEMTIDEVVEKILSLARERM